MPVVFFERIGSLDGTYIANVYSPNGKSGPAMIRAKDPSSDTENHTKEIEHLDFSEDDVVNENARK
jgi:hypothetical protein